MSSIASFYDAKSAEIDAKSAEIVVDTSVESNSNFAGNPPSTKDKTTTATVPVFFQFREEILLVRDEKWRVQSIRADGATALHAVLGKTIKGSYYSENARQLFVTKFQERRMVQCVQDAFHQLFRYYYKHLSSGNGNSLYYQNAYRIFSSLNAIADENTYKSQGSQIVQAETKKCLEAYQTACQREDYNFTRYDLELIAQVFQTKIEVFSTNNTLAHTFGGEHKTHIVLWRGMCDDNCDAYYLRCIPPNFLQKTLDAFYEYQYRSPRVDLPIWWSYHLHNAIQTNSTPLYDPISLIVEYAGIPLRELVNAAMQDVLEKENWATSLTSYSNWRFVEVFRHRVTSLKIPAITGYDFQNRAVVSRVQRVVCRELLPNLNDFSFGAFPAKKRTDSFVNDILSQYPRCRSLSFQNITLEQLHSITRLYPDIAANLESLHVEKLDGYEEHVRTSIETPTLVSTLTSFKKLTKLLIPSSYFKTDAEFQMVIQGCPGIQHVDLRNHIKLTGAANFNVFNEIIFQRKRGLQVLDISCSEPVWATDAVKLTWPAQFIMDTVQIRPNCLRLRNCLREFGNSIVNLINIDTLIELDLSNIPLNENILKYFHDKPPQQLRVLKMRNCFSEHTGIKNGISNLEHLEELDITGCTMYNLYELLGKMKNLKVLRCGGFLIGRRYRDFFSGELPGYHSAKEQTEAFAKNVCMLQKSNPDLVIHIEPLFEYLDSAGGDSVA